MEYLIKQYGLQQGALEIEYIEEFFLDFPRKKLAPEVIQRLAEDLNRRLLNRDPLSERVHHRKSEAVGLALSAAACFFGRRLWRKPARPGIAEERP